MWRGLFNQTLNSVNIHINYQSIVNVIRSATLFGGLVCLNANFPTFDDFDFLSILQFVA